MQDWQVGIFVCMIKKTNMFKLKYLFFLFIWVTSKPGPTKTFGFGQALPTFSTKSSKIVGAQNVLKIFLIGLEPPLYGK